MHARPPRRGAPRARALLASLAAAAGLALGLAAPAAAATLDTGLAESEVVRGLVSPTAMAQLPDGRVLVAQQGGALRVVKDGALLSTPMLSVPVSSSGERGLIGVAVDPAFPTRPYVYVHYTRSASPVRNVVSRFTVSGDTVVAGSEQVLFELEPLTSATNHNGGALGFGGDGKLYIAVGENAQPSKAQLLDNLFGKMLRIEPDGGVPADNPFAATATGANRAIYAYGLRNPFTFAVQPRTGRILVNDVGQASWEEIDDLTAGANYGWPLSEGATTTPGQTTPLLSYSSSAGPECAITGGAFYDPEVPSFPAGYAGDYLYADFCAGWIRRLDPATGAVADLGTGLVSGIVGLLVEPGGDVLYLTRNLGGSSSDGRLMRIANTLAPTVATQPQDLAVTVGDTATFTVGAGGTGPFTFQWQRDGIDIPGQTAETLTLPAVTAGDDGARLRVRITSPTGSVVSRAALLSVSANRAPTATITAPTATTTYAGGDRIAYAGVASDPEDGTLPGSAVSWRVDFHHDTHLHPFIPETPGALAGEFVIPTTGETSTDVWYRITMTVRDSGGRTASSVVDVRPRTVRLQLATQPAGLSVLVDGQPVATPATVDSVVGMERSLGPVSPQTALGTAWLFTGWADGGAANRVISTPAADTAYTARFAEAAWQESGGQVVLEAEQADETITRGGRSWSTAISPTGWAGTGALVVTPNAGATINTGYATTSPQARYRIRFTTTGTYQVWVRGRAPGTSDNSIHIGLDGAAPASADRLELPTLGAWAWSRSTMDGVNATITVTTPGIHTLEAWMREDGFLVDRILLTRSTTTVPSGTGPAASPRGSAADLTPPAVTARTPTPDATGVGLTANVVVTFSEPMAAASVSASGARLVRASDGAEVSAARTLSADGRTLTIDPASALDGSATYRVDLGPALTDAAGNPLTAVSWVFTTAATPPPVVAWQESGGQVVIEAEQPDETIARGGRSWGPVTSPTGWVGSGALLIPNTGGYSDPGYVTAAPQARYRIRFATTGTYQVWIRGRAPTGSDNSLHIGLDGAAVASADRLQVTTYGTWLWSRNTMDGVNATITVATPGVHTLEAWMREDGLLVDRILLTRSTTLVPSGTGPAASPRV